MKSGDRWDKRVGKAWAEVNIHYSSGFPNFYASAHRFLCEAEAVIHATVYYESERAAKTAAIRMAKMLNSIKEPRK